MVMVSALTPLITMILLRTVKLFDSLVHIFCLLLRKFYYRIRHKIVDFESILYKSKKEKKDKEHLALGPPII